MVSDSQAVWFCYSIPCAAPQGVLSASGWWVSVVFGRCLRLGWMLTAGFRPKSVGGKQTEGRFAQWLGPGCCGGQECLQIKSCRRKGRQQVSARIIITANLRQSEGKGSVAVTVSTI